MKTSNLQKILQFQEYMNSNINGETIDSLNGKTEYAKEIILNDILLFYIKNCP